MGRKRSPATELAKLLNAVGQPIYVLDGELTVVFLNDACRKWIGPGAEGLPGRRCAYHSSPDADDPGALAAALCPPPAALAEADVTATVAIGAAPAPGTPAGSDDAGPSRGSPQSGLRSRRARFVRLGESADEPVGLLALVDAEDLPESPPAPSDAAEREADALHEAVRRFRAELAGRHRADRLVGESVAMRRARQQVELAAGSRCSVLLVGPPGSGRQHVATAIHYGSDPQAAGALIPLDCSVLGAELMLSTVGTLVHGNPLGERAARSALLLSQTDQLPAEVQADLAGLLCGRPFALRLLATAGQPLVELARRGRFREDLAAVLSTITIELPPLAERREDLPVLAQMLLEDCNVRGTRQVGGFTPEALDRLCGHAWPGNLDELARTVAEAHERAAGPEIRVDDLPQRIHWAADAAARPRRPEETILLDEFLARLERELIRRALAQAKGNKARAARLLGLTRPRLYRRMTQLGLE